VRAQRLQGEKQVTDGYNTKGTRAHTHRELIREWLWETKGSFLNIHTNTQEQHSARHDKNNTRSDHTKNHPPAKVVKRITRVKPHLVVGNEEHALESI